jgi:hypothetical protein
MHDEWKRTAEDEAFTQFRILPLNPLEEPRKARIADTSVEIRTKHKLGVLQINQA